MTVRPQWGVEVECIDLDDTHCGSIRYRVSQRNDVTHDGRGRQYRDRVLSRSAPATRSSRPPGQAPGGERRGNLPAARPEADDVFHALRSDDRHPVTR